ncbi:MAG TPA: tetratricopeptide repeat protein [Gemmataceae bacterium]|nr:tetratricopeptide repeat protein [Gemmataceae bacterium]
MAPTMRWLHTEYILKGIFLGLLLFVALRAPDWPALGMVALLTFSGLALFLCLAGYGKLREGYRVKGRFFAFLLFLILESPQLVYAGILAGMLAGALYLRVDQTDTRLLIGTVGGGVFLGIFFSLLRHVRQRWTRLLLSMLLASVLVAGALFWFGQFGALGDRFALVNPIHNSTIFGCQLLLGIPLFYLLTLAGKEEESEVEFGAMCAALGLGAAMLSPNRPGTQSLAFIIPLMLYIWYTTLVLPRLRVFKHTLRGFSYAQIGRYRQAILSFRRALEFDPTNKLAGEGLWSVHRALDFGQLAQDPETLAVVNLDMCLERAASLLLQAGPSPENLQEAHRLLDLVMNQRPQARAAVHYWRGVALTHARQFDEAAAELGKVLDPSDYSPDDLPRQTVLLSAWQLAVRLHPELSRRVGTSQLAIPGRRLDAIAAVERQLAASPEDTEVWALKRLLYQDLTEAEYEAAVGPTGRAANFDHEYVLQLGLALISDSANWKRACAYLRMAARGLPGRGPSIFTQIAQAHQREGQPLGVWKNYELAKRAGREVGVKELSPDERQAYFAAIKLMADGALTHNAIDLAIENYQLYAESERSGLETLRILADLYERKGDALAALRVTEQALIYDPKDKDLLQRKDRYYYSVMPDDLRACPETVRGGIDVAYCLRKSRLLLDAKNWDLDTLDWAQHLAEVARVCQPESRSAKVLVARARLRRGEKAEAVALLEEVRSPKPEQFASGEEEDAWYLANKLLGEAYLYELNKPDLAVECLKEFRHSSKSGADTLYKLGQAYEQLGDRTRAVKFYKHVVSYDNHPLAPDAYDALHRLQSS